MLLLLSVLVLCVSSTSFPTRIIHARKENINPSNPLQEILDPFHEKMANSGLYAEAEMEEFQEETFEFYINTLGLNFSSVAPGTVGQYVLPQATLYPYGFGDDFTIHITYDNSHPGRGITPPIWYIIEFGSVALITQPLSYSGSSYSPGHIIGFLSWNLVKTRSNWSLPENREVFHKTTNGLPVINSEGRVEYQVKYIVVDEGEATVGVGILSTIDHIVNGEIHRITDMSMTFR